MQENCAERECMSIKDKCAMQYVEMEMLAKIGELGVMDIDYDANKFMLAFKNQLMLSIIINISIHQIDMQSRYPSSV